MTMKIEIKNATIRIDNHKKGNYSSYFATPFDCFITVDFSGAKVSYEVDGEKACRHWKEHSELFKMILWKTAHETNKRIYSGADMEGYFVMKKDGAIAVIKKLSLKCTTAQLESETSWEKSNREQIEGLRETFAKAKVISIEDLNQMKELQLK